MNTEFNYMELSKDQQELICGGGNWPGADLVNTIFDIGKQVGRALAQWI